MGFLLLAATFWGPGFFFGTITATGQEITLSHALTVVRLVGPKPLLAMGIGIALALALVPRLREDVGGAPYLAYAGVSWLVFAATVGTIGGSTNYFIEPWLATLL